MQHQFFIIINTSFFLLVYWSDTHKQLAIHRIEVELLTLHTHVHTHIHTHMQRPTHTHAHIRTHTHIHTHSQTHTCTDTHTHVRAHAQTRSHTHTTHTHIQTLHTHTHTHTHTHKRAPNRHSPFQVKKCCWRSHSPPQGSATSHDPATFASFYTKQRWKKFTQAH